MGEVHGCDHVDLTRSGGSRARRVRVGLRLSGLAHSRGRLGEQGKVSRAAVLVGLGFGDRAVRGSVPREVRPIGARSDQVGAARSLPGVLRRGLGRRVRVAIPHPGPPRCLGRGARAAGLRGRAQRQPTCLVLGGGRRLPRRPAARRELHLAGADAPRRAGGGGQRRRARPEPGAEARVSGHAAARGRQRRRPARGHRLCEEAGACRRIGEARLLRGGSRAGGQGVLHVGGGSALAS
mmetsp:Transcript_32868/g.94342  ORF Transcript_32868/g.94342 Transcript_32868/m.94342 type:complete len:237 (+) Transcript_32868:604-1314(+)